MGEVNAFVESSKQPSFISIFVSADLQKLKERVNTVESASLRKMLELQLLDVVRKANENYANYLDAIAAIRSSIKQKEDLFSKCPSPETQRFFQQLGLLTSKVNTATTAFVDLAAIKKELSNDSAMNDAVNRCEQSIPPNELRTKQESRLTAALDRLNKAVQPPEGATKPEKDLFKEKYEDWKQDHRELRDKLERIIAKNKHKPVTNNEVEDFEDLVDKFDMDFTSYANKSWSLWKAGKMWSWVNKRKLKITGVGTVGLAAAYKAWQMAGGTLTREQAGIYGGTRKKQRI